MSLFFFKKIHNFTELFDKIFNRYNKISQKNSEVFWLVWIGEIEKKMSKIKKRIVNDGVFEKYSILNIFIS